MKLYRILSKSLGFIRWLIDLVTNSLFPILFNGESKPLPAVENHLLLKTASSLALKIRSGKLKSRELLEVFIKRIEEIQPIVNCMVDERFKAALKEADEVDALVQSGTKTVEELAQETPFLGVPFTTKDSITVTGLSYTAGLVARKGVKGQRDAASVSRLRKAGGIILAITNVSEMCLWWESCNNVYGRTKNPYHTSRIVGGSSGGEAAILASAGSVIGIGSDVGGSIRMPCFFCGIFGHKPSPGVIPYDGQIPKAEGEICDYLVLGPMCRYASDLVPLVQVLAGNNSSLLQLEKEVDISKLRIFYTNDECGGAFISRLNRDIKNVQEKVLTHFQNAFKTKPVHLPLPKLQSALSLWSVLMTSAEAPTFAAELAQREGEVNTYWELFKWIFNCSPHTLPAITLGIAEKFSPKRNSKPAVDLKKMCSEFRRELDDVLGDDGVLIFPSHPEVAPFHNQPFFKAFNFIYTAIFNVLGLPVTQCPLGLDANGLPTGVQIVAATNMDRLTLAVAVELEKAFGGWVCPSKIN